MFRIIIDHFFLLSPEEADRLLLFVKSPYYNTDINVVRLFKYLHSRPSGFPRNKLTCKYIYRNIYRNQKYNNRKFSLILKNADIIFRKFVIQSELEKEDHLNYYYLLKGYERLNIFDKIKNIRKEIVNNSSELISKDIDYYINSYRSEYIYFNFATFENNKELLKSTRRLYQIVDLLIINLKLEAFHVARFTKMDDPKEHNLNLTIKKEIFELIESKLSDIKKFHPDIYVSYLSLRMWENDAYFFDLIKYYNKNKIIFKGTLLEMYINAYRGYCITRARAENNDEWKKRIFTFIDYYYVKNKPIKEILLNGKYIRIISFINIVLNALRLNKIEWTEKFIEKNKIYLPESAADEVIRFSKAILYYNKKEYIPALKNLNNISGKFTQMVVISKIYILRIYFETEELNGIQNSLTNLKSLKKNKKINHELWNNINQFLKYFNKLFRISKMDKKIRREEIMLLRKNIEDDRPDFLNKSWLLKRCDMLISN